MKPLRIELQIAQDEEMRKYIKELINAEVKNISREEMRKLIITEITTKMKADSISDIVKSIVLNQMQKDISWQASDRYMRNALTIKLQDKANELTKKYQQEDYFGTFVRNTIKELLAIGGYL